MQKILLFGFVFIVGLTLGGGLRYSLVEAQLGSVAPTSSVAPNAGASLGQGGGGSCG